MNEDLERLRLLLSKYTNDECTLSERLELMSIIKQSDYEKEIKRFIENEISRGFSNSNGDPQLSSLRADILFKKIINNEKKEPVNVLRPWRFAAAAVIIGMIGIFSYFWLMQSKTQQVTRAITKSEPALAKDALPGTKGAILTLSNGQQIILDSAGNGKLAWQGSTVIVNKHGQIVYNVKGNGSNEVLYNTMTTPRGRQYQLLLSDGTKVWLNSESSIRYPAAFAGITRDVTISGEAYFEVAKNEKIPFVVKVDNMEVKVMGTHFNINAYHDEESIKTTLLEGSVKVLDAGNTTVLAPGQQSKVSKTGSIQLVKNADLEGAVAWKNGVFLFNKADIQSVMRQIGRWYDLEIAYEGEIPKDRFGGKLPMDAKVSQVLGALEQTQVHFRIEGKKVIVLP